MANQDAVTLDAASWVGDRAWAEATDTLRSRYLRYVALRATGAKRRQIQKGRGADGEALARVLPASRPDGATGPPLQPHFGESRSQTRLRSSVGRRHVTIWWGSGWGKILGYHARGEVIGAPIRNIIGFTAGDLKRLRADARDWWRHQTAGVVAAPLRPRRRPTPGGG